MRTLSKCAKTLTILGSIAAVLGSSSCKQSDTDLDAIVGNDNGRNKALAIVGMKNSVELRSAVATDTNAGKQLLESIYETYFGLVECDSANIQGQTITADSWMNLIEFYSFTGLLYLDKDRRLVVFGEKDGGETKTYFPCGVISAQLLTAPMVLASAAELESFPMAETIPPEFESRFKDKFLLVQAMYLALRGPHAEGSTAFAGLMATTLSMASQSYPEFAVTDNSLVRAMQNSDPFFNPCSQVPVQQRQYLRTWRNQNFDCVPSSTDASIRNFRPSASTGYPNIRKRIQDGFNNLSASVGADAESSPLAMARRVLRSTMPWNEITGADASFAKSLYSGGAMPSAQGFTLAGDGISEFRLPENGAPSDRPEFGYHESSDDGLNLTADDPGAANLVSFVASIVSLFQGSQYGIYQPNYISNAQNALDVVRPDQMTAAALSKQIKDDEGKLLWHYAKQIAAASGDTRKDALFSEYLKASGDLEKAWLEKAKTIRLDPTKFKTRNGFSSITSEDGRYTFRKGEVIGSGRDRLRTYENLGPRKIGDIDFYTYRDLTAPGESGGFSVERSLYRFKENPDVGGQSIKTALGTFTSRWQATTPGGNTGHFRQNENDLANNRKIINDAVGRVRSTVESGTQQGTNWRNLKTSVKGMTQALSASAQIASVGRYVSEGGEKTFGASSESQKELRNQAWQAAKQTWNSGRAAAADGLGYLKDRYNSTMSYFGLGSNKPTADSSTPVKKPRAEVKQEEGKTARPASENVP